MCECAPIFDIYTNYKSVGDWNEQRARVRLLAERSRDTRDRVIIIYTDNTNTVYDGNFIQDTAELLKDR